MRIAYESACEHQPNVIVALARRCGCVINITSATRSRVVSRRVRDTHIHVTTYNAFTDPRVLSSLESFALDLSLGLTNLVRDATSIRSFDRTNNSAFPCDL